MLHTTWAAGREARSPRSAPPSPISASRGEPRRASSKTTLRLFSRRCACSFPVTTRGLRRASPTSEGFSNVLSCHGHQIAAPQYIILLLRTTGVTLHNLHVVSWGSRQRRSPLPDPA